MDAKQIYAILALHAYAGDKEKKEKMGSDPNSKGEGTGEPLFQKIYDDLRNHKVKALRDFEANTCFAAGTLVHTQGGLKPIEQIQVGDMVLSKHESGEGERAYKRVTKTFVHEDREVMLIIVGGKQADGSICYAPLIVTPDHPIWVRNKGWKKAAEIKAKFPFLYVESISEIEPRVMSVKNLYKSSKEGHAWSPYIQNSYGLQSIGGSFEIVKLQSVRFLDENSVKSVGEDASFYDPAVPANYRNRSEHRCKTTVYNLEVEDFHTYYVTEDGIWVHNKNLTFKNPANGSPLTADVASKPFITSAERKKMGSDPNSLTETAAPHPALSPAPASRKAPVVLDTNIILDVFIFDDIAAKSVKQGLEAGELDWIATQPMRDELERVLAYPQIVPRLAFYELSADDVLAAFDCHARLTDTVAKARLTCKDADDQKFIDLAVAAQALLLSKDRHILSMAKRLQAQGVQARKAM